MPRFGLGERFTRRQIHDAVGGGLQDYLPHKGGEVVCGCFRTDTNPEAPHAILVGKGPQIERWAERYEEQGSAVPIFLKRSVHAWEYVGDFRVRRMARSGEEIAEAQRRVGRPVTMVMHLERS